MGWFSTLFRRGGDTVKQGVQQTAPSGTGEISVTFDSAMSVSAFWASVSLLTETVAAMPLKCYQVDTESGIKKIDTSNSLWQLLNYQPNSYMTRTEFLEFLVMSLVVYGNSYFAIKRNSAGEVVSLMPLVASQMQVELVNNEITYHYTDNKSYLKVYAPGSIWHTKRFGNGLVGLSPLGYAAKSIGIAQEADKRVAKLASSGGKSTGVLTIDAALKPEQRENIRKEFIKMTEGPESGLHVLEAGLKFQQTSMSPSDMQLIENRRFQIEDIARFMGVPSVLINDTSASTTWGSGIEQITQGFYKLNLRPMLERIESSMKRHLMPRDSWANIDIEFDFDALLRADKKTRMESQAAAVNAGLMTPNEGRAAEGLEPKDGGDKIYLNSTLVPAGQTREGKPNGT